MRNRVSSVIVAVVAAVAMTAGVSTAQEVAAEVAPPHEVAPVVEVVAPVQVEAPVTADAEATAAGPRLAASAITVRTEQRESQEAAVAMVQSRDRRGTTLMMVGGAAFLAGLLIGDDAGAAVAVGGALVGLYGLYIYMQ